uniref:Uncharacterized protein n=1 Tax=Dasya naccarioides TaxID=2007180 RepID=A0A1Z1MHI9_9FLOR|nr:hypothetical protein [Dasya naccarioides]ARW65275.1 hypothetical protein [Dasya naccarioides]
MKKKIQLIYKISLLLISIEALNINSNDYFKKYVKQNINKKSFIYLSKFNRNINYYYIDIITTISFIYQIINDKIKYRTVNKIIGEYNEYTQSQLTKQYLTKFTYIYNKIYDYYDYDYNHYFNSVYIYKLAIINLYLIKQINQTRGFFILTKYLYNPFFN